MSQDYKTNNIESWERSKIYAQIAALDLELKGRGYPAWMPRLTAEEHYINVRRYSDLHGMCTFNEIQKACPVKDMDEEDDKPRKQFKPTNYRDPYD